MNDAAIVLEGAPNFRDLGGLPAGTADRVRRGLVYRSEALHALTDRDLELVGGLEIALFCDLRTPTERTRAPNRWLPDSTPEAIEVEGDRHRDANVEGAYGLLEQQVSGAIESYMRNAYSGFPRVYAPVIADLAGRIADGRLPLLVHCAAGKDRTGFVCAMLLHAVGVERETIEADYLRSDVHFGRDRIAELATAWLGRPADPDLIDGLRSRVEYLELSIAEIESEFGSIDTYLEIAAGISSDRRAELRERLLERVSEIPAAGN